MPAGRDAPAEPAFPWRSDMLEGKTAIVTGGSAGIGAAITTALLQAGAKVAVLARNRSKYDKLVPILEERKLPVDKTTFISIDLSSTDAIQQAAVEANEWAGGCADILVNNAGVASIAPILEASVEDWDWTMNVNVRAPFIMAKECAKRMIARGQGGKIVSVSSTASLFALHDHAAYCTSKAAIQGLTKVMSAEWSKYDINCNTVGPTIVLTDMGAKAWGEPSKGDPMIDRTPLGRFAEPWEMAHGVVFLVSPSSAQMCGQMLLLDGGITTTGTPCGTY
ncbi:unnamed protein product [Ectocarpus fasciculatus]